jgi:hypothetical protein
MKKVIDETCFEEHEKSLFRAVIRKIGCWKEVWESPMNYRDASGGVSGFIYYSDTEPFAKRHLSDILCCLNNFEQELGEPLKKDNDNTMNWYAWFALEHIIDKVVSFKESAFEDAL